MMPVRLLAIFAVACLAASAKADPERLGPEPRAKPRRVVSLAPSLTEAVIDLGLADRLVGVTRFCDAKEAEGLPRVGGYLDPSAEAILALRPDLLLVQPSPGNRNTVERLSLLGVPVLVVPLSNLREVDRGIRDIAAALGEPARGDALVRSLREGWEELRVKSEPKEEIKALIVYSWHPLVVAGPGSFAEDVLHLVGGRNAAEGAAGAYPTVPLEAALAWQPEKVIDATFGHEGGRSPPWWEDRIVRLRSPALARPGPRLLHGARELAELLRGKGP